MHNDPWKNLDAAESEIHTLTRILALLGWDQETYMPEGAVDGRARQTAYLESKIHAAWTSESTGALLEAANPDGDLVKEARKTVWERTRLRKLRLPTGLVERKAALVVRSQAAWSKARRHNAFGDFLPYLSEMVEVARQTADLVGWNDHPYTALLDEYEPGATASEIDGVFEGLQKGLVSLLAKLRSAPQPDTAILNRKYPAKAQEAFGKEALTAMGFDWSRGRLDVTSHPFCTTLGDDDVRLTTRYDENFFNQAVYGMIHEMGHGLYEQGFGNNIRGTILAEGTSLGVHESQSRFWENIIGRSPEWVRWAWPLLRKHFPETLKENEAELFSKAINKVTPSLIRVEADEVTYGLHIILRYRLEKALVDGSLQPKDVPTAWNDGMRELLGITPPNDTEGCLQDIHWSMGGIGYFPTYVLGNLYAAQWRTTMQKDMDIPRLVEAGDFQPILDWLRKNIHQFGKAKTAEQLVKDISCEPLNPQYFVRYLEEKFAGLLGGL